MGFLKWLLSSGPVLVTQIESIADQYGHTWAAVEKAKAALGVETVKVGPGEAWSWQIVERINIPE